MSTRIEESVSIPQNAAQLWPLLSEPSQWPRWIDGLLAAESIPPGPLALGSRVKLTIKGSAPIEARVTRVIDQQMVALEASGLPMDLSAQIEFGLQAGGSESRVRISASTELTGMLIFAEKMVVAKGSSAVRRWLEQLAKTGR
jgi:Polyketide cyclase / dehydrase and lipid transport